MIPETDPDRLQYVAFDLETTGLSAESDRIVEVGAVRFDAGGADLGRYARLVNPRRPISAGARRVHGISDSQLVGEGGAEVVLPEFLDWLGDPAGVALLAHNASFDAGFLGRELARLGRPLPAFEVIDTLALARRARPDLRSHRLDHARRRPRASASTAPIAGPGRQPAREGPLAGPLGVRDRRSTIAYPLFDPLGPVPDSPAGWGRMAEAIASGRRVRMEYSGGTRGIAPREISPRRFSLRGGAAYLVAFCHLDASEKSFRLDRVVRYHVLGGEPAGP